MSVALDNFYSQWRVRYGVVPVLREDQDSPPEHLLQAIWQHQRLRRDQLRTLDGDPVRVLHPGFRNVESGPDFRGALVQVGDAPPQSGDVEVDLHSSGWRAHGHDRNPAFQQVILHVIWESGARAAGTGTLPILVLRAALDAPLGELSCWLGGESAPGFPAALRGRCCAPLRGLSPGELRELLHQAAFVRLRSKAAQFQARAKDAGWEQALWEGLFRALGYKNNIWPMQRLAELRPRWATTTLDAAKTQGRLLGLSGLLPADLTRAHPGSDQYLRRVWDQWWRERDEFSDCLLPRAAWRLHGLRPANHPQRRLALAAGWSAEGDLVTRLTEWCARSLTAAARERTLLEALQVVPDEFWSWHWTLRSTRLKRPQPLLGATRLTDLAVNVVLPWLWIRALEGKNDSMRQRIEESYFTWPPAQDNSVLRLARQRLLGCGSDYESPDAAAQQGLMQIVRDFCDHSNALCENCRLPELVRELCRVNSNLNCVYQT